MFIYKKPRYDSESEDSDNGARCCKPTTPFQCPTVPDLNLTQAEVDINFWIPSSHLDETQDGWGATATAIWNAIDVQDPQVQTFLIPSNGSNVPLGSVYSAPVGWTFTFYYQLNISALTAVGYDLADPPTVFAKVHGIAVPEENIEAVPIDHDIQWNGQTVLSGENIWEITVFPLPDIGIDDPVNCEFEVFQDVFLIGHPECPQYVHIFNGEVTQSTPELPIAQYRVRAGHKYDATDTDWDTFAPFFDIPTCEENATPVYHTYEYDQNNKNVEISDLYFKHHVNQAYWDSLDLNPRFVPTGVTLKLIQAGFMTRWQNSVFSTLDQPGSLLFHKDNVDNEFAFNLPGDGWPFRDFAPFYEKSETFDSLSLTDAPPFESGTTHVQWKWTPSAAVGLQQATAVLEYKWTDGVRDIFHYTVKRIQKQEWTPKALVIPQEPCWNKVPPYNFPTPFNWSAKTSTRSDFSTRVPWFIKTWEQNQNRANNQIDQVATWQDGTGGPQKIQFIGGQGRTDDFTVQFPYFFDGSGTYPITFVGGSYERWDATATIAGAPRNVTWSICHPNQSGTIANGQFSVLQFGDTERQLQLNSTGTANCQGLMYITLNLRAFPSGPTTGSSGVQRFSWIEGRMPDDCVVGLLDCASLKRPAGTTGFLGTLWGSTSTIPGSTITNNVTLTYDITDMYPGDNGRSLMLHTFAGSTYLYFPSAGTFQRLLRRNIVGNIYAVETYSVRDCFNPRSNRLTLQFGIGTDENRILGISYLRKV